MAALSLEQFGELCGKRKSTLAAKPLRRPASRRSMSGSESWLASASIIWPDLLTRLESQAVYQDLCMVRRNDHIAFHLRSWHAMMQRGGPT